MQVLSSVQDEVELWIEEGYERLLERFTFELTKEEQAVFLWNAHVALSNLKRNR